MMTPFPPKTPMQMRRKAEQRGKRKPMPPGKVNPSARPPLLSADSGPEVDATTDWLAHTCPEPAEGSPPAAFRSADP